MPHYLVKRFYDDLTRRPQVDDQFTLGASSVYEAIDEARLYSFIGVTPRPSYCVLYRVTRAGRKELWDSRQDKQTPP